MNSKKNNKNSPVSDSVMPTIPPSPVRVPSSEDTKSPSTQPKTSQDGSTRDSDPTM